MSLEQFVDRRVFVDTSAFFAAANRRDADHLTTAAILQQLIHQRVGLVSTNFILAELHALLLTRINRDVAFRTLQEIDRSEAIAIIRVTAADEIEARAILERYDDKDFSLTDATCFSVMERFGIGRAFTLDRNFVQYGVEIIPLN
jgi:predicted nucleic acid-binding protein